MPRAKARSNWRLEPPGSLTIERKRAAPLIDEINRFRKTPPKRGRNKGGDKSVLPPLTAAEEQDLLDDLARAIESYELICLLSEGPTKGEMAAALKATEKAAEALIQCLEGLDDASIALLVSFGLRLPNLEAGDAGDLHQRFLKGLAPVPPFLQTCKRAIAALDRPEYPAQRDLLQRLVQFIRDPLIKSPPPFEEYLFHMADVFKHYTEREPTCYPNPGGFREDYEGGVGADIFEGTFARFAELSAKLIGVRKRVAIGKSAQNALKRWKEYSEEIESLNGQVAFKEYRGT